MIREEAHRRHGHATQTILPEVANSLRTEFGPGILALRGIEAYRVRQEVEGNRYAGLALTGIRAVGEAQVVTAAGGVNAFLEASLQARFARYRERMRSGDPFVELGESEAYENAELTNASNNPAIQDILGVRAIADYIIPNNGSLYTLAGTAMELACGAVPSYCRER